MAEQRLNIVFSGDASQLTKTIDQLEAELKGFQSQLKGSMGANEFNRLNQSIAQTKAQMAALKTAGSGLSSSVVGMNGALKQLSPVSNQATQSMINLGRVVQDAPFGFLGIANNLNPLLESFQRLKATTGTTGGALKALGSSLLGAGGLGFALSVVSSLLIVFGDRLFGTKKGLSDAEVEARKFRDSINDIKTSVDNAFASLAIGDKLKKLTNELKSPGNAEILNLGIDKESIERTMGLAGIEIEKSFKKITNITKNSGVLLGKEGQNLLKKYQDVLITGGSVPDDLIDKLSKKDRKVFDTLNESAARIDAFESQRQKARERIGEIELQTQIKVSSKLKDQREQSEKDYEKFINDTIGKARQFVKEFGKVLVLPDLEDSFFKTKESLIKEAKKVLSDVSLGKITLRVPVSVVPEFLPVTEREPSQRFMDELRKQFQEKEVFDLTIPVKTSMKGIDDAIKGFAAFGDAGVREFLRVSKAGTDLQKGFKAFKENVDNMKAVALEVGQLLTGAFEGMFDAIEKGGNGLKGFFDSMADSLKRLISRLLAAAAAAAILSALTGGKSGALGGFGKIFQSILGFGGGGIANPGSFGSISGSSVFQGNLVATVRGTDLAFVLQQGQNTIGRSG